MGLALLVAVGLGFLVRAMPVFAAPFPLGDGGLFAVMATDLRANGFAEPLMTSYNGGVPFAYPPLAIYLLALWPGDVLPGERILPLLFSTALIPAVWLLARSIAGRGAADVAALVVAFMPGSWALFGGDVPRGLWLLLGVLSVWQAVETLKRNAAGHAVAAGLLAGAAALAHPAATPVIAASWLVLGATERVRLRMARRSAAIAVMIFLIMAGAWAAGVSIRYGSSTLIGAATSHQTAPPFIRALALGISGTAIDLFTAAALIGLVWLATSGRYFLPAWTLALLVVPGTELRALTVPVAIAAGVAWADVLGPRLTSVGIGIVRTVGVAFLGLAFLMALASPFGYRPLRALDSADREAMSWVATNSPRNAVFAVVTPADDTAAEWFPALASRQSVTTYQGQEWVSSEALASRVATAERLRRCETVACARLAGAAYLYLAAGCCPGLRASASVDLIVYDADGVTVARLLAPP